jgi:hypothetical protein
MPTAISNELAPKQASRAMINAKIACASVLDELAGGDLFLPNNDHLLMQWTSDRA